MRSFIISLIFVLALMLGSGAHAEKLDMSGLSEQAVAELALQAAQLRKDALNVETTILPDVVEVEKYVGVGEQIGKALATTARELGIEVNNFASTPVGLIAIFLIVWHFFGNMMVHLMFGATWFITLIPLWVYFFKRLVMARQETYNDDGKRVSVTYAMDASSDTVLTFVITGAVIFFVGIVGIFTY